MQTNKYEAILCNPSGRDRENRLDALIVYYREIIIVCPPVFSSGPKAYCRRHHDADPCRFLKVERDPRRRANKTVRSESESESVKKIITKYVFAEMSKRGHAEHGRYFSELLSTYSTSV